MVLSLSLFCTPKEIHLEEQKQNCLLLFGSLEPSSSDLETKMFFFYVYVFKELIPPLVLCGPP